MVVMTLEVGPRASKIIEVLLLLHPPDYGHRHLDPVRLKVAVIEMVNIMAAKYTVKVASAE
jgi:hypothetical protein